MTTTDGFQVWQHPNADGHFHAVRLVADPDEKTYELWATVRKVSDYRNNPHEPEVRGWEVDLTVWPKAMSASGFLSNDLDTGFSLFPTAEAAKQAAEEFMLAWVVPEEDE